jgi:hypothetical protein
MPLAPLHSAEWLQFTSTPPIKQSPHKWGGKMHYSSGSLTFTGAGVGTAKMFRLPPGKVRVWSIFSRLVCPQGTTNADLHVGYAAHVNEAGTPVVADDNAFADNLDLGAAALAQSLPLPAVGYLDLDSQNGIDVEVMIDTANSPAAGEMMLCLAYQRAG